MTTHKTVTAQERLRYCDEFGIFTAAENGMAVSYGEAADLLDRCREALEDSLYQLRLDAAAEAYHNRALALLTQLNGGRNV